MPQPARSDVHVNRPLTNISIAYIQGAENFIADRVFPVIPVAKQSDRYFSYDKDFWFRSEAQERVSGAESAGSGFTLSSDTYFARVYAVHKDVDDMTRANTDDPLDSDRDATLFVTQQMLLKKDLVWQSTYFKTGVWAANYDGTGDVTGIAGATVYASNTIKQWDASGSDPISDITKLAVAVQGRTGFKPNTLVLAPDVLQVLMNHTLILDRIKYTQRGIVSTDLIAALFGVDKVLVASAVKNSSQEGQTISNSFLFSKAALFLYVNPNPSIMQPSSGYTFAWTGLLGAGAIGTRVKRFRMEAIESDRIEAEMAYDHKVVATDLGGYITSIIS